MNAQKTCPLCGTPVGPDVRHCPGCGERLTPNGAAPGRKSSIGPWALAGLIVLAIVSVALVLLVFG